MARGQLRKRGKIGIEPTRYPGSTPAGDRTEVLDTLSRQTGLSHQELLARFSRELPDAVDRYTPQGRLPHRRRIADRPRRSSASVENISAITIAAACATQ